MAYERYPSPTFKVTTTDDLIVGGKTVKQQRALSSLTSVYDGVDGKGVKVRADPVPAWATFLGHNDSFCVSINNPPDFIWPGGQDYACYSAITGAIRVPPEAASNTVGGGTPGIIIAAGLMGLALTSTTVNVGVGVYASGGTDVEQGRAWAFNGTLLNGDKRGTTPAVGKNGQFIICENDMNLHTPPGGWSGTNAFGSTTVLVAQSQPDGYLVAHQIQSVGAAPWKTAFGTDAGSAQQFAEIHMVKNPGQSGGSGSQTLHFISSTDATNNNAYRHGIMQTAPSGDFVFQPNYFGTPGQLIVGNSTLTQVCKLDPANGFFGPRITVNSGSVSNDFTIGGSASTGGSFGVGTTLSVQQNIVANGSLTCGSVTTGTVQANTSVTSPGGNFQNVVASAALIFKGVNVELSVPGTVPGTHSALIVKNP